LIIKGTDDITVNPVVSVIEAGNKQTIYQIKDETENTTKLFFKKIKKKGKEIKAELASLQYNNNPIIEISKTELKYEWSLDKKTGKIKELEQKIKVKHQFRIKAKYSHQKDGTKVEIKIQKAKQRQIFPDIKIIKLITKSGVLEFNF